MDIPTKDEPNTIEIYLKGKFSRYFYSGISIRSISIGCLFYSIPFSKLQSHPISIYERAIKFNLIISRKTKRNCEYFNAFLSSLT